MRARAIVASLLFGSALGAGGWWVSQDRAEVPALAPVTEPVAGARLFEQVYRYIATQYVDSLPLDSLYRKAVAGLVFELNDPYSAFLPENRTRRLKEQMGGAGYSGVGINVDIRDGWATVIEPFAGAPAERAGIQAGDRIIAVDGESTVLRSEQEVANMLRGEPGSMVQFTVERFGVHRFTVNVKRQTVVRPAVPRVVMISPEVGYVDLNVFNANSSAEVRVALDSLNKLGAHGVVLDLRGNPGGLLEQGVAVAELFLDPSARIVEMRGRPGTPPDAIIDREPQWWPKLAVAVLVDRNSASASEIVAGALQDNDRAIIVGQTSFGKGSAQTVFPMTTGGALRITTSRWYTPLGRSISPVADTSPEPDAESDAESDTGSDAEPATGRTRENPSRPRFTTAMGRTVLGGGGVVPDVFAGDSVPNVHVQAFARALGVSGVQYRDALARVALLFKERKAFADPLQPVTRAMVNAVWDELVRRKVTVPRSVFDAAAPWIARSLGYEAARVAFGPDAEFRRRAQDDAVIARALRLLDGVQSPREPFARADDPGILVPMRAPTLED